ncbi:endoglycoceramidase, partial [Streptomyces sioyaensis]
MRLTCRVAPAALASAALASAVLAVAALVLGVLPAQAQARPDRVPDRVPGRVPDRVTVGDRTFIADGQGRALQWRGFNLADKSSRGTHAFAGIHDSDLKDMAARGFNLARLA